MRKNNEVDEILNSLADTKTPKAKPIVRKRIDAVIEKLPDNKWNYRKSAIEGGYSKHTAKNTTAIKKTVSNRLKELEEQGIKIPRDKYFDIGKMIAKAEEIAMSDDYTNALKVIIPKLQEHEIMPKNEVDTTQKAPTLIIGIRELNVGTQENPILEPERVSMEVVREADTDNGKE